MSASPNDLRPTLFDPVDGDEIDESMKLDR